MILSSSYISKRALTAFMVSMPSSMGMPMSSKISEMGSYGYSVQEVISLKCWSRKSMTS